jgi:hypothetical protein
MYPQQPQAPLPGNHYDFIMNPPKPKRRSLFGGDPFIAKIIVIVGGAVALMIVGALVVNIFLGGKTSIEAYVGLAQSEQEIARLSAEGEDATSQEIKNASAATLLSATSHKQTWVTLLGERGREVKEVELSLKKDATIDTTLENARQSSTFDATYTSTMRTLLEGYASELRAAYDGTSNKDHKETLSKQFEDAQLLLKQWPK